METSGSDIRSLQPSESRNRSMIASACNFERRVETATSCTTCSRSFHIKEGSMCLHDPTLLQIIISTSFPCEANSARTYLPHTLWLSAVGGNNGLTTRTLMVGANAKGVIQLWRVVGKQLADRRNSKSATRRSKTRRKYAPHRR
jgi:hypothetical protein